MLENLTSLSSVLKLRDFSVNSCRRGIMSWTLKAYTTQPLLCSTKYVRKLPESLKIIEENNPTDRRSNVAKRYGLAPSALNAIVARRREIRKQKESPVRRGSREGNQLPARLSAFCFASTRPPGQKVF